MTTMRIDGTKIAKLREDRGLSQAQLARQLGIKQPSLWEIENNQRKTLKSSTLQALCEALSTTPDYILGDLTFDSDLDRELVEMESELVKTLRKLGPEKRIALMEYARYLRKQQGDKDHDEGRKKDNNVHSMDKLRSKVR